jgi:hypothetical protein
MKQTPPIHYPLGKVDPLESIADKPRELDSTK